MSRAVRTDFDEVKGSIDRASGLVDDIIADVNKLETEVRDMANEGGIKDKTLTAVSEKLAEVNEKLSPATGIIEDLGGILKRKSDELEELVGDSVRQIDNI